MLHAMALFLAALLSRNGFCEAFVRPGIVPTPTLQGVRWEALSLAATAVTAAPDVSYALSTALKKPSKTLSVILDIHVDTDDGLDQAQMSVLSMQLRNLKASALVTSSVDVAALLVQEQADAAG